MRTQRTIRRTLLAVAIAAIGATGTALADGNDDFSNPQQLEVGSGGIVTILGRIGDGGSPDVDYYSFQGNKEETITVDIDETTDGLNTVLHLFSPNGTMKLRVRDALWDPVKDPGSQPVPGIIPPITRDADLQFKLDATGVWKVAVTAEGTFLTHNGGFLGRFAPTSGGYKLIVSGLKPSTLQINVDIKPGNNELAPVNPKAKGVIPVAILSDSEFDPFQMDVASLRFGRLGNEPSYARCAKEGTDLNGDGKADRVCHFYNQKTGFRRGDTFGILTGTFGGKAFEGRGDLKVVPEKEDD